MMGVECCTKNYIEVAKLLLRYNADIDAIAHGDGQPDGTPINVAINYGDFNMTEFLLKEGADTSIQDGKGKTALCEITKKFNIDAAKELIQHIDLTYTDPFCNPIGTDTCIVEANHYQKVCSDGLSSKCKEHFSAQEIITMACVLPIAGPVGWLFTGLGAILGGVVKIGTQCCGVNNLYTDNGVAIGALASATLLVGLVVSETLYNKYTDDCIAT